MKFHPTYYNYSASFKSLPFISVNLAKILLFMRFFKVARCWRNKTPKTN